MSVWARLDYRTDNQWARDMVDKFPRSWQGKLLTAWHAVHTMDGDTRRNANLTLLGRVHKLSDSGRGGISPDAGDAEICTQADLTARDFARRLSRVETIAKAHRACWAHGDEFVLRVKAFYLRALLEARGLLDLWPTGPNISRAGAVLRVLDPRWWRRTYRKLHARTVEASAIGIGLVSRVAGLYASDDAVKRRRGQNARNAAALEAVTAVNDHYQAYTLADLAARGTANKTIRRVELLTRIAGFELIAKEMKHIAYMVTVSCPSRFHKCTTQGGRVKDNPKYDGSDPSDAQKYLSGQWSRLRAAAARFGLDWYGFRIAEPQHDATPHWHILLFMSPECGAAGRNREASPERLVQLVRRYFLENESPNEPGAQSHRVDFERIDWAKGSAVGYVIKYISKNIDGHGVGLDLFGNDAVTSSARVEAWASTWRIRQFQQIGGAPVTVWRELRRLDPDNSADSGVDVLADAIAAINRQKTEPGVASIAWKKYIQAQGGISCKRKNQRIKLLREQTGECGRYGEVRPSRPVGVSVAGFVAFKNHIHVLDPTAQLFKRPAFASVESERAEWLICAGAKSDAEASARRVFGARIGAQRPWIHVNNCTRPPVLDDGGRLIVAGRMMGDGTYMPETVSEFAPVSMYRPKLRKFRGWENQPERENYASQRFGESQEP